MISPQYFLSEKSLQVLQIPPVQCPVLDYKEVALNALTTKRDKASDEKRTKRISHVKCHDVFETRIFVTLLYDSVLWGFVICKSFVWKRRRKRLNIKGVPSWTFEGFSVCFLWLLRDCRFRRRSNRFFNRQYRKYIVFVRKQTLLVLKNFTYFFMFVVTNKVHFV